MFYNEVMTFGETEVTATCCKLDGNPVSVTCGQGLSCAASCFSKEAFLCPSRDCNACDNTQQSEATTGASDWRWCSSGSNKCKVNPDKGGNKGCCFNPTCQSARPRLCRWLQLTAGSWILILEKSSQAKASLLIVFLWCNDICRWFIF